MLSDESERELRERLTEFRQRQTIAAHHARLMPCETYAADVGELLALVERLVESTVPTKDDVEHIVSDECEQSYRDAIMAHGRLQSAWLLACEVHGIKPPAWLVARAGQSQTHSQ